MAIMCPSRVTLLSVSVDPFNDEPINGQKNAPPIAHYHSIPVKSFQATISNDSGIFNIAIYLLNRNLLFIVYYLFVFPTHPSSPRGWKNSIQYSTGNAGVEMLLKWQQEENQRGGVNCGRSGTGDDSALSRRTRLPHTTSVSRNL